MNISQVHRCILWILLMILQVCFSDLNLVPRSSMPVRELSREQAYTGNEFAVTYIVQFQNGGCVMSGISIGLPKRFFIFKKSPYNLL
jgi:hypothetical protein